MFAVSFQPTLSKASTLFFKRGMRGIYQHCSEQHLHRYMSEFDFRYSHRVALGLNDEGRTSRMVQGIVGKRLKYRTAN